MIAAVVAAIALTVSPARVELAAGGTQVVRVTNAGSAPAVLDVTRAGFALTMRGQPRIVTSKAAWLLFSPRRLVVEARSTATLTARARSLHLSPGDHPGLLLLTQHPVVRGGLAVRTRIGVVVSLRVPGRIVHRLVISGVRIVGRRITVTIANSGNVTELLRPGNRELLPRTRGVFVLRYAGPLPKKIRVTLARRETRGSLSVWHLAASRAKVP